MQQVCIVMLTCLACIHMFVLSMMVDSTLKHELLHWQRCHFCC